MLTCFLSLAVRVPLPEVETPAHGYDAKIISPTKPRSLECKPDQIIRRPARVSKTEPAFGTDDATFSKVGVSSTNLYFFWA